MACSGIAVDVVLVAVAVVVQGHILLAVGEAGLLRHNCFGGTRAGVVVGRTAHSAVGLVAVLVALGWQVDSLACSQKVRSVGKVVEGGSHLYPG